MVGGVAAYHLLRDRANLHARKMFSMAMWMAALVAPVQMVADTPENYAKHPGPMKFIRDVPTDWEETRVLNGEGRTTALRAAQPRPANDSPYVLRFDGTVPTDDPEGRSWALLEQLQALRLAVLVQLRLQLANRLALGALLLVAHGVTS